MDSYPCRLVDVELHQESHNEDIYGPFVAVSSIHGRFPVDSRRRHHLGDALVARDWKDAVSGNLH